MTSGARTLQSGEAGLAVWLWRVMTCAVVVASYAIARAGGAPGACQETDRPWGCSLRAALRPIQGGDLGDDHRERWKEVSSRGAPLGGATRDPVAPRGRHATALPAPRDSSPKPSLPLRLGTGSASGLLPMMSCPPQFAEPMWGRRSAPASGHGRVEPARAERAPHIRTRHCHSHRPTLGVAMPRMTAWSVGNWERSEESRGHQG